MITNLHVQVIVNHQPCEGTRAKRLGGPRDLSSGEYCTVVLCQPVLLMMRYKEKCELLLLLEEKPEVNQ